MPFESMPRAGLKECNWTPVHRQTIPHTMGGDSHAIELGRSYWTFTATYQNLTDAEHRALSAFINRRKGAVTPFRASRPDKGAPLAITASQTPTLSIVSGSTLRITTTGGLMSEGDMVAYTDSTAARIIGEIDEITNTGANYVDCTLLPGARAPGATPAAQIFNAEGIFRLIPGSVRGSEPHDHRRSISFEARQVEKPITEPA